MASQSKPVAAVRSWIYDHLMEVEEGSKKYKHLVDGKDFFKCKAKVLKSKGDTSSIANWFTSNVEEELVECGKMIPCKLGNTKGTVEHLVNCHKLEKPVATAEQSTRKNRFCELRESSIDLGQLWLG